MPASNRTTAPSQGAPAPTGEHATSPSLRAQGIGSLGRRIALLVLCIAPALPAAPRISGAAIEGVGGRSFDLAGALAALEAPEGHRRAAAERWLAIHLDRADFPDVAQAVARGGSEVGYRLTNALASDSRHLGLAALCSSDHDDTLRDVGLAALRAQARAWVERTEPIDFDSFLARIDPRDALGLRSALRCSLTLSSGPLAVLVGRLDRALAERAALFASTVVGLAIDPDLASNTLRSQRPGRIAGTWAQVFEGLLGLFAAERLELTGYGTRAGACWLYLHAAGREPRADELLADWVRRFERGGDDEERLSLARALAGSAWPAALAWLEDRWLEEGDPAARVGILYAAARGRVSVSLTTPAALRELLGEVEARVSQDDAGSVASAEALLRVLVAIGPTGPAGEDLARECLAGWDELDVRTRWVRLYVLESMGRVPAQIAETVRAWAGGSDPEGSAPVPAPLAWQALRTLAASRGDARLDELEVDDAPRLFASGMDLEIDLERVLEWLERARARPAPRWRETPDLGRTDAEGRLAVAAWWLLAGEAEPAAHVLGGLRPELTESMRFELRAAQVLSSCARSGRRSLAERAIFSGLPTDTERHTAERLALLSVGLDAARARALFEAPEVRAPETAADFMVLGALAAHPGVALDARERLISQIEAQLEGGGSRGLEDVWVPGLERAFQDLLLRADDAGFEDLQRRAGRLEALGHPFYEALTSGILPTPPGVPPVPLEALDRSLPASWGG